MGLSKITNQVVSSCPTCLLNNPQVSTKPSLVQPPQHKGSYPREDWKVDFTHLGTHYTLFQGHKYLLVFVDTFMGLIEAFSTHTERTQEAKMLLHEITPRFSLLCSLQSNNGVAFTSTIVQMISEALEIEYILHCARCP